ncbi:MAG: M55 family metallopeptidase [Armatimonadetes bacterium]|nr:M55 family metallopeptidase [Armatimonadota bacterium]MDI9584720.1 M55 family metallopeptidase [Acidobacteriota bacterium]
MRIYIHTDLEGVSGIGRGEMVPRDSTDYELCRELLMGDLNAAVDGAFAGGATEVMVLDSHGGGNNFILEKLDRRAINDTKPNRKWWGVMDQRCDATFFIGAHAMAGTMNAFLDHTQSSLTWHRYSINGREMGELAQWALVAGNFGVPMVMVSGDEAACVEARQFFRPCKTAIVKTASERQLADCLPLDEARQLIWQAAHDAIAIVREARPFRLQTPMEIITEFNRCDYADNAARSRNVERIGPRTVRKLTSNPLELFPW